MTPFLVFFVVMETVLQTYIGFQLIIKKLGQKLGQVQFAFTLLNLFEFNPFEPLKTCI